MNLFYRKYGDQGPPLFILHGLFGQSDNWQSHAKTIATWGFEVYVVDLRNHGMSPHAEAFNYTVMAEDLMELMDTLQLGQISLMGHSMGGKAALTFANNFPERVQALIIIDIGLKYYPPHHQQIIAALQAVNFETVNTRKQAHDILSTYIDEEATKQFLLKNIYWKSDEVLDWRFNLPVIANAIDEVGAEIVVAANKLLKRHPMLFVYGENSSYIQEADKINIMETLPNATLVGIPHAGHWVHVENPKDFIGTIHNYLILQSTNKP